MPPTTAPTLAPTMAPIGPPKGAPTRAPVAAVPAVLAVHERTSARSISNSPNAPEKSISVSRSID